MDRDGAARPPPPRREGRGREPKSWWVYILRCAGGTLYTGITNDLDARLRAHAAGRGAKYTRGRLPVALLHREETASRAAAARRERDIKRLTRREKLALAAPGSLPSRPGAPRR